MGPTLRLIDRNRSLGLVTGSMGRVQRKVYAVGLPSQEVHLQEWIKVDAHPHIQSNILNIK